MATAFSLKQRETRTGHGPIPHPLTLKWPGGSHMGHFTVFRLLIASNFWPVLFAMVTLMDTLLLTQKKKKNQVFSLISISKHGEVQENVLPLNSYRNKNFNVYFSYVNVFIISYDEPNFIEKSFGKAVSQIIPEIEMTRKIGHLAVILRRSFFWGVFYCFNLVVFSVWIYGVVFITKFHRESGFLRWSHGAPLGTNMREIPCSLKCKHFTDNHYRTKLWF